MKSDLTLDTRRFTSALLFVEQATGRTIADSLNRAALHVIIGSGSGPGAMQLTPKATPDRIKQVSREVIRGFVIKKLKRTGRWPQANSTISGLVQKEIQRRLRACGYAAYAGYSNAAKAMGGRGVKGVTGDFARSEASHGVGRKASKNFLEVMFTNTAPAIERIGVPALQVALDNAARDLEIYAQRKFDEIFRKL